MRVLFLIQGPDVAASRYRVLQYLPLLEREGIASEVARMPDGPIARWRFLGGLSAYDLVFFQRKRPRGLFLGRARRRARRIVYDFDDALWFRNSTHEDPVAPTRARVFRAMLRAADLVIAGNRFLADGATADGAKAVVLPSPIDVSRYAVRSAPLPGAPFTIGWVGAHGSIHYLERMRDVLDRVAARVPSARLEIVCDRFFDCAKMPVVKTAWSEAGEAEAIARFDVGLMPLLDDPWSWGKCGLKVLQYGAAGVPAVVTPVGINREIVRDGQEGRWATTPQDWEEALVALAADPATRHAMGLRARARVEAEYSLEVCGKRLAGLLREVAGA